MQTRSYLGASQARNLLIFLVTVGYLATFFTAARNAVHYTVLQLVAGLLCGVAYVVLALFQDRIFHRLSQIASNILFFSVECALVLGIGLALGPGGTWLIGLPLVSMAVEFLPPRGRWLVYLGVLVTVILPILYYSTLETALMNTLFISPGILFVALISQAQLNERRLRENAERLTRELEAANRQLAEYASQAEELAATQERNRLAREIHDNLGHYLTIVNVQIEAARLTLASDPARALDALTKAQELTKKGLTGIRESVAALRVSPTENRPLEEAIAGLVSESQAAGLATEFHLTGDVRPVESKSALALYRSAQEGLTNVHRHACASRADVTLDFSQPDRVRLTVQDDGVGTANASGGFGLVGIQERVQLLGGEFRVETEPGKGFQLEVSIPVADGTAAIVPPLVEDPSHDPTRAVP
jgi:signal transduction histidine kinase